MMRIWEEERNNPVYLNEALNYSLILKIIKYQFYKDKLLKNKENILNVLQTPDALIHLEKIIKKDQALKLIITQKPSEK